MREWIISLCDKNAFGLEINFLDLWHIGYLVVILGVAITLAFVLRNKSAELKRKVINAYLIAATLSYALDFFIMPLYDQAIDVDKLPFHICTILSIISCFGQFNKNFSWVKTSAVVMCTVAPFMYLCYPGTALGGISPLSYKVVQTFFYHACIFTYGFLSLAFGEVKLHIKECWKELALVVAIALWAGLGNWLFNDDTRHFDWMFLTGSTFPFVHTALMPFAAVGAIFGMAMVVYGFYYLVLKIIKNKQKGGINYGTL